jgi:chemotaxis protein MotB
MPEGPDGKTIIIIKKVSGHGGHHGGAWKVAYADFVTAMMALFMVLWLVNSAAEPTRERIASYFRKPGIFQKGSGNPMEMGGGGILPDVFSPASDGNSQIQVSDKIYTVDATSGRVRELYDEGEGSKENRYAPKVQGDNARGLREEEIFSQKVEINTETDIEQSKLKELKTEIEKAIQESGAVDSFEGILGDIEIKIDQRGLVIEIMDTEKTSMFHSGQAVILGQAENKLLEIGNILKSVPNPIDIEGHTDASPFKGKRSITYDNWNLSTDRANAARRILEKAGFEKGQIARVVGYAAERPRDTENALNPANRRITISMRYTDRAKEALDGTKTFETNARKKQSGAESRQAEQKRDSSSSVIESDTFVPIGPQLPEAMKKKPEGLQVEVSTVVPENVVIEERKTIKTQEKKDLIFESPSAFFKK